MGTFELSQGQVAIVDDEDFDWVTQYEWHLKRGHNTFYAQRWVKIDGKWTRQKLHRFILGLTDPRIKIDHKDGNGLNNHRQNLRIATKQQNQANQQKQQGTSSRFKGVTWDKNRGKWSAQVMVAGKNKYLGRFDSELKAAQTYDQAAQKYFGNFAKLNAGAL